MVTGKFSRVWVALFGAMLAALVAGSVSAQTVRDVPPDHWAYEAVMDLVERGYIAGEDGLFRGDQPADRFTLATVVARILREIETGGVQPQSREDVELLRRVVTEFREELVAVYARLDQMDSRIDTNARQVAVQEDKMSEVIALLSDVIADVDALERRLTGDLAEQEAALRAELQAEVVQLQQNLNQLRDLLDERENALRSEVIEMIAALKAESEDRMAALEANVRQALAESGIALGGLQESLEADAARLRTLEADIQSLSAELDELIADVEQALAEIRSELNAQSEALAAQQLAIEEQRAASAGQYSSLQAADAELAQGVQALQQRVDALDDVTSRLEALKNQVDGVERQVLAMQSQIGLSEEQLRALSDRLMDELESQYQHSFLLAGTVAEELKALREEFNSYRQNTERELASARQAQMFGIIGALLGLIGLAN